MKLNVQDYLYHGLNESDPLKTLNSIFKSGYIYTRKSLKNYLSPYEYLQFKNDHPSNWNGNDAISISCHPEDNELIAKYNLLKETNLWNNAYDEYIKGSIVLVLDKSLLDDFEIKKDAWKMNFEIQILGDIPVKYIKAIAISYSQKRYTPKDLYNLKKVLLEIIRDNKSTYFNKYYDSTQYLREEFYSGYTSEEIFKKRMNYIYEIKKNIESLGLDIPFVDLKYGYPIPDENKQRKRIKELEKIYNIYRKK